MYEEYDSFIACFERAEEKEIRHAGVEGQRKNQRVYGSDQGGRYMKKRRAEDMEDWELDDAVKRRKNEADYKRYSRSNQRRERAMEHVKNASTILGIASGAAGLYKIAKDHNESASAKAGKKIDDFLGDVATTAKKKKKYAAPTSEKLKNIVIPKDVAKAAKRVAKQSRKSRS